MSKRELERAFEKYGSVREVWIAHAPPCFAFVVYWRPRDAEEALHYMDGA